jgi:hypothetical protein
MSLIPQFQYEYPKLNPNWDFWILMIKIFDALGTRPDTNDFYCGMSSSGDNVIIHTARELTPTEKAKLDAVMSDPNAGLYPQSQVGFTVFEVRDLYDAWKALEDSLGIKIRCMFCNVPDHTKLEVWVDGALTSVKKKQLMDAYAALIKEK